MTERFLKISIVLFLISVTIPAFAQDETDTLKKTPTGFGVPKSSGIFLAPDFGFNFPMGSFADKSAIAVNYGARIEYASLAIYPFIPFAGINMQKHNGSDAYMTENLLNYFDTEILSVGGGVYFLANKYLRSNFTSPFLVGEVKYYNITRTLDPDKELEGVVKSESKIIFSAGLGFTLYIFDIISAYDFAGEYSNLNIRMQIHIPVIRF
jgi:hypothetical protein